MKIQDQIQEELKSMTPHEQHIFERGYIFGNKISDDHFVKYMERNIDPVHLCYSCAKELNITSEPDQESVKRQNFLLKFAQQLRRLWQCLMTVKHVD